MKKIYAKSLVKGKKTATVKVEYDYPSDKVVADLDALYALLGGYNEVARHVDFETFKEIRERFNEAIDELSSLIR